MQMSKRGSAIARRVIYMLVLQSFSTSRTGEAKNPILRDYYLKKSLLQLFKIFTEVKIIKIIFFYFMFIVFYQNRLFVIGNLACFALGNY